MKKILLILIFPFLLNSFGARADITNSSKKKFNIEKICLNDTIFSLSEIGTDTSIIIKESDKIIGFQITNKENQYNVFNYCLYPNFNYWKTSVPNQSTIFFTNLASGEYQLLLKNIDEEINVNQAKSYFNIKNNPVFVNTFQFYALLFGVVLFGIFLFLRNKHITQVKMQQKLEQEVRNRTIELEIKNKELESLNSTKNRFFSIIGHDLKNPLNALIGFSDLLLEKYESLNDEKRLKFITIVNESSKLMYEMLINLLDWSRSQSGILKNEPNNFKLIKIVRIASEYNQYNANKKNVKISPNIEDEIEIFVDYNMIMTVLRNLINNAVKYSKSGDTVDVFVEKIDEYFVTLAIKDYGIGMSPNQIKEIFKKDTFNSTPGTENEQGTGLGLVLCIDFIKEIGGKLIIESQSKNGTSFLIDLPLYKREHVEKKKSLFAKC